MKFLNFVIGCCVLVAGCSFQTKHRGYVFPENLEEQVQGIKKTKKLQEKLGSPQVKTVHGDPVWIYYSADENYHGPFPVSYDNRTALLVWTDGRGNILKKKIMKDEDFTDVKIADGETKIPAAIELNALQELFNNVGRFSPAGLGQ